MWRWCKVDDEHDFMATGFNILEAAEEPKGTQNSEPGYKEMVIELVRGEVYTTDNTNGVKLTWKSARNMCKRLNEEQAMPSGIASAKRRRI